MTDLTTRQPRAGRLRAPRRGGVGRTHATGAWPLLFIGPSVLGLAILNFWPLIQTAYFRFTKWGVFGGSTWIGTANYERLVVDPGVGVAILNTLAYTAIVLLGIPLSVFFASLINRPGLRFAQLYRVLFFMPYIAMPVAVAMVWRLIYNGDSGILNWFLSLFGITGPFWTSTPGFALVAVGIVGIWTSTGFNMIILSAGLKTIPAEYYEAAQLDGAGRWQQFRSITVPLLTPSIFFVTVITVINGFQLFDLLFGLLGPNNPAASRTQSIVYLFYMQAFQLNDKGYAAAIAMVILVLIGFATYFQFRFQKKWVNNV